MSRIGKNPQRHSDQRKRPFRGHAIHPFFQTTDLGSGDARYIERQATRFPLRKYAAVDLIFEGRHPLKEKLRESGVHVSGKKIIFFLKAMIRAKRKTRHITIDMPYPYAGADQRANTIEFEKEMRNLFELFPKVLFPNGKIFITTEQEGFVAVLYRLAQEFQFGIRERKPMSKQEALNQTWTTAAMCSEAPIYRVTLTYNLKKAFPSKIRASKMALY